MINNFLNANRYGQGLGQNTQLLTQIGPGLLLTQAAIGCNSSETSSFALNAALYAGAFAAFWTFSACVGIWAARCRRSTPPQLSPTPLVPPDLNEKDLHDLSLIALMSPDKMPSLEEVTARLSPSGLALLKRYHDAFYSLQPIGKDLEEIASAVFSQVIPREPNGRMTAILDDAKWYQGTRVAVQVSTTPTENQISRARTLGLTLMTGGCLLIKGTRNLPGLLSSAFKGYHIFINNDGKPYYSLKPIDDEDPEEIVGLYRFIGEHTRAQGIMAEPAGIHFYRGEPRILFEILRGRRMFCVKNTDPDLPPGFEKKFDEVMSTQLQNHKRVYGRFGDDLVLEEDYMFICDNGLRIGLPVRVRKYIQSVKDGRVFRLI